MYVVAPSATRPPPYLRGRNKHTGGRRECGHDGLGDEVHDEADAKEAHEELKDSREQRHSERAVVPQVGVLCHWLSIERRRDTLQNLVNRQHNGEGWALLGSVEISWNQKSAGLTVLRVGWQRSTYHDGHDSSRTRYQMGRCTKEDV